jgi:PAS domain-containing protein
MSDPTATPAAPATLRQQAQALLVAGGSPASRGWGVSVEALALLHRLASTQGSASDALKLLHELQVHQVELDLQHAQLEANERELTDEVARYRVLYEQLPVAHFVLDAGDRIVECNRAGADLFGASGSEVSGRRFDGLLSIDSRASLAALLRAARDGAASACCTVWSGPDPLDSRCWRLAASALSAGDAVQLVVTDGPGSPEG